ncbi:hypothetical protein SAMN05444392_10766 [Seinonella peptonophila]|uniref:GAPS4 PD-(D/E)XK nuclease domain-containing protein n=1 Tax=Seinonella peptonophila TaxID=112248 RepID=A0A1M4YP03_9BACL|nr:hypothetical protein [Seinonella peptonophila]SHF07510.1 hypothetical protein SAMN05444392_10766 [Seinonella peptonophila]
MAGEDSKNSGEFGEKIVEGLLELIGWSSFQKGLGIDCFDGDLHKIGKSPKTRHGIDFYYSYDCPLVDYRREDIVISVKHTTKPYPLKNPTTKFKEYLKDLAHAIECFEQDIEYKSSLNTSNYIKDVNTTGVLFWLSSNKDEKYGSVIEKITNFRPNSNLSFNSIYLVDNKRATFLLNTINYARNYARNKYNTDEVKFVYPSTGYNSSPLNKVSSGDILPVQYINSTILPVRVDVENQVSILLLFINDCFSEQSLKRLVGLSHNLTEGWASEKTILYPDYSYIKHNHTVSKVKQQYRDQKFIKDVYVSSYLEDIGLLGAD